MLLLENPLKSMDHPDKFSDDIDITVSILGASIDHFYVILVDIRQKDKPEARPSFAFNYGTTTTETSGDQGMTGALADVELTPLEEDNILDHLEELTPRDRDILDLLGREYQIDGYFRMLRRAQQEQVSRVNHLKMTAVVILIYLFICFASSFLTLICFQS